MDMIDVQNACSMCAMPKELIDKIWKPIGDSSYMDMMKKARKQDG